MPTRKGSIHLFRLFGVDVFLHWWWFLVAVYEIQSRAGRYSSITWNVFEYLALFLIVLMHEFGHALACRQVGGKADRIVLWPLGGVAYVDPPQRPGATLWSIAAGPLVNVALIPVLAVLFSQVASTGASRDLSELVYMIRRINIWLLIFNILPIYPLDGGQILRSLLWFVLGRARSLLVATIVGLLGVVGGIGLAIYSRDAWLGIMAFYLLMNCWGGLKHAQDLLKMAKLPRRDAFQCPSCKTAPAIGEYWKCSNCGQAFDTFQTGAVCPNCRTQFPSTRCLDCGHLHAMNQWAGASLVPSNPEIVAK
ncbi:MAG: peptidase M50 [Acidobacteria bacterium]|nr:MAG: peptidase M50 [Acidobacteriota bacterium]